MSRYEAIKYIIVDHVEPSDLKIFLKKAQMSKKEFFNIVDKHRDKSIWEQKVGNGLERTISKNHLNENDKQKNKLDNEKHFIKTKEGLTTFSKDIEANRVCHYLTTWNIS